MDMEKKRANCRKYYLRHREEILAKAKARRAADPQGHREASLRWSRSAKGKARHKAYVAAHPEQNRAGAKRGYEKKMRLCAVDPDAYAKHRAKKRVVWAKDAIKKRGCYSPNFARRIPDWCAKGGDLDVCSAYLAVNATFEQAAFARDLAIERKNRRTA